MAEYGGEGARDYVAIYTPKTDIDPASTCLVVVDVQYATGTPRTGLGALLASQGQLDEASYRWTRIAESVIPNTRRLLDFFRANDLRRVFLTYGSEVDDYSDLTGQLKALCTATKNRVGEREHEIVDELKPWPSERVFNKITPSAFTSTPIDLVLSKAYGVDTLLFVGVSTNMCVEHTQRDAASFGYNCFLVEDACGADSQEMHDAAVTVLQRLYGTVTSTDQAIEQLSQALGAAKRDPALAGA
ncbi:MAG: cysteine hydrolase family protein [Gaiellales bacterium]